MALTADTLRRTPLYERHAAAGARLVPFAGWEMPVQYEGIRPEHLAVRRAAGLFDVSHMGQIETRGPDSLALLQRLLSNDVERIQAGGAQYSVLCRDDGGVLDDLFTYRLDDRFLTVTNASNHARDLDWLRGHASGFDVEVVDAAERHAMLALQGPRAREILATVLDGDAPARMRAVTATVAGVDCLVCGTGYTGEDGVEVLVAPEGATTVWDALIDAGAARVGLGARDTLRLEACYHLYGNDLSEDRNPIEAGLGWCCKLETGFVGSEALAAVGDPAERLVPFALTEAGVPRAGNPVVGGGVVTSGGFSPCLERGIGLAYVPAAAAAVGSAIEIDVRGRRRAAEVRARPLYTREDQ